MNEKEGNRIPSLQIVADTIPQAYYRAVKAVWENGLRIRTEYDRKEHGEYIDPPSRDARVLIEVINPLGEPRFNPTSFCERGKYLAEMIGVKNNLVLSFSVLKAKMQRGEKFQATEWPYHYHQRLWEYPLGNGETLDQIAVALDRVAKTPFTRRSIASTAVPEIDIFMDADLPCLREMQIRVAGDKLNLTTTWRSRDLYKAWADNVTAVTFWQKILAETLSQKMNREIKVGSYADFSMALHIYGQDFQQVGGDEAQGIRSFFANTEDEFVAKAMTSETARDGLIIPELEELLKQKEQWKIDGKREEALKCLIGRFKAGYLP